MLLRLGASGPAVEEVRSRLTQLGLLDEHSPGVYDDAVASAVRMFQQDRGLTVDGVVGPDTYRRLEEARWRLGDRVLTFVPSHLVTGDDVVALQGRLMQLGFDTGRIDGMFGPRTDAALREFQRSVGEDADGVCGPASYRAFDRLVRTISGGNAGTLRERVKLSEIRTGVTDKVIVIDPGVDAGAEICEAIAVRTEGRLTVLGTQVLLTRSGARNANPDEHQRADFANRTGADLLISINCTHTPNSLINGVGTFYYGEPNGGFHSTSGRLLAERVHDEVCARTEFLDCRTHPRTWDLLRMTRMAAIRIDIGNLSNLDDAQRLGDPEVWNQVADGIASGISRFCAPA